MTSVNTQAQARTPVQAPQKTNDRPTVSEAIDDTIACLWQSGGHDSSETEQVAIATLAELCRLKLSKARELWIRYAATVTPA